MKHIHFILIFLLSSVAISQNDTSSDKSELYKNYREDQFYFSVTYNLLNEKPKNVNQSGFSTGFHFGFIRDMPINEQRNIALGLGIGLSSNSYNQNIFISENNAFSIIDDSEVNVTKNKFTTYLVEIPFEFRFRTSTPKTYKFFRVYPGFKLGYVFYNSSKFKSDSGNVKLSNIDALNRLQYGVTLSAGYGTWNLHAYYGLNAIFDTSAQLNSIPINMSSFKIGLMFYIL